MSVVTGGVLAVVLMLVIVSAGCHQMFDGEIEAFRCEAHGAFGAPVCPDGLTCVSGTCTDVGVPFGYPCEADDACPVGAYCLNPADFGATGVPRCSHLCCGSADCGPEAQGSVCRLPEDVTGGFCWPAAELDRPEPGLGRPGSECAKHSDCRSSLCASGTCVGACCGDSYCEAGLACRVRLSELSPRETFTCGVVGGPNANGICNTDDDCASGRCVESNDMFSICAAPCCSSTDCVEVATSMGGVPLPVACASVGTLRACSRLMTTNATGQVGTPCVDGEGCRSGICLETDSGDRICSDSCCDDESCGDPAAFACLPVPQGETWALRCVPK